MRCRLPAVLGPVALATLSACVADLSLPPPPLAAPPVVAAPPAPPATPALVVVPRAEASPRRAPEAKEPTVAPLRSEGKRHALARTTDGVVVLSEERGVVGFLSDPDLRWAGFIEDDAVLALTPRGLLRAATPEDAVAGRFTPVHPPDPTGTKLAPLDPAATVLRSAGKVVVAAAPMAGAVFSVSRDGGRHFASWKRPAPGPLADLAVRSDGMVVAAIEREPITREGTKGMRTEIWTARAGGAWQKGPLADALYGPALSHHGDSITIDAPRPGEASGSDHLGLDAAGKWIATDYAEAWLYATWTDGRIDVSVPEHRPGFPKPPRKDGSGGLGMLGGMMGSNRRGVACLAARPFASPAPRVRAFHDGVCAPQHVQQRTETHHVFKGHERTGHEEQFTFPVCDPRAPAQRAATLLLRDGEASRLARLPLTCAEGSIVGTDRAAFVRCTDLHAGRSSLQVVSPAGALAEIATPVPADLSFRGAESASDGTTVLVASKAVWVCQPASRACAVVTGDDLLAARPLPGGRALLARRGTDDHELVLELFGEAGAAPLRLTVPGNLLELEVTAEGYVRLWTSATKTWLTEDAFARGAAAGFEAVLVRADGALVRDAAAR
jgi:hypothetical protein